MKKLANMNKAFLKNKVNVKYKEIGPNKDRTGIIRKIKEMGEQPEEEMKQAKKKRIRNSSSLPAIKQDRRIPDSKKINIFDQGEV